MLVRRLGRICPYWLAAAACLAYGLPTPEFETPVHAASPLQEPLPVDADRVEADGGGDGETEAQVIALIKQLDSMSFAEREAATDKLGLLGVAAIVEITKCLPDASPEVAVRGVFVISRLAGSGKAEEELAARNALELIGALDGPAGQYARSAIGSLDQTIQKRAVEELKKLGAELNYIESRNDEGGVFLAPMGLKLGDHWHGQEHDLRWLQAARSVNRIVLEGEKVTPAWFKQLPRGSNLTTLIIKNATITNECVEPLSRMTNLVMLEIRYCKFGDDQALRLAGLQRLERLRVLGGQLTEPGEAALKQALINANIDVRRGAFLGVQCVSHPLGAAITFVQPGSAAARHGLSPNDVIVSYNGEPVRTFEDLTRLISQHSAEREVPIQVTRNANIIGTRAQAGPGKQWGITLKSQLLGQEILDITPAGLGHQAGLRKGDILVTINDTPIDRPEDLPSDGLVEIGFMRDAPEVVKRDVVLGKDESDWGP